MVILDSAVSMASLYRRHRPRTFADVVGQEHVVRTLRNAITADRVHHAYLFVGSRGTGKTSMAKILAAALNCSQRGEGVEPCGVCDSCVSIASATSLDVIEMDAASNNSVDDVRDLRERVAYAPLSGRHKVYILDEAHMLTVQAWNAFLKTLEEPPPHTIFVLATTEAQKILPTVADRCHRFDFSRPTVGQISGVLRRAAAAESIEIPEEACALVARSATGSFRDALGTLEQLVAYSGSSIALDDVLAVLGAADADLLFGTVDAVAAGSPRDAMHAVARLAESGRDVERFFKDLEAHLRGLMIVHALGGQVPEEIAVTAEQDARLAEQAGRVAASDVTRLLDLLAGGWRAMKDGADARTQLELALVKASDPASDPSAKALLSRLERLEARAGGAPAPVAPSRAPEAPATAAAQRLTPPAEAAAPAPVAPAPPAAAPVQAPSPPAAAAPQTATAVVGASEAQPATAVVAAQVAESGGIALAVAGEGELSIRTLVDLWPAVIEQLSASPHLGEFFSHALPVGLDGDTLTLAFSDSMALLMKQAERPTNRDEVAAAVRAVTGKALRLAYELRADEEIAAGAASETALSEDELIDRIMREFDATVLKTEEGSA